MRMMKTSSSKYVFVEFSHVDSLLLSVCAVSLAGWLPGCCVESMHCRNLSISLKNCCQLLFKHYHPPEENSIYVFVICFKSIAELAYSNGGFNIFLPLLLLRRLHVCVSVLQIMCKFSMVLSDKSMLAVRAIMHCQWADDEYRFIRHLKYWSRKFFQIFGIADMHER